MRLPSTDRGAIDKLKNHFSKVQIADKDGDLDRDGYTSASWDGDAFSNGATGTINWVTAFGLPEIPKFANLQASVKDTASAGGVFWISFKAKVGTTNWSAYADAEVAANNLYRDSNVWVPVADNGTTYWAIIASGVNTMNIWLRVNAWIR